ncbi:MAG: hypothetical protein JSW18_02800 [Candidatus Omnitrophota bacterium]|nr:MAG: hypothetical protein JSW18_02800 [Candidatus Omnitrophota bacterium]
MPDTFLITLVFIALCTIIGAFVKGRSKDRCLVDFKNSPVTLELKDGKSIWGRLNVEHTGIELIYDSDYLDEKEGHYEKSYILYKNEFDNIELIVRHQDKLNQKEKTNREKILKQCYKPNAIYRVKRKLKNFFSVVRDALVEVFNLFMGRIRTATPAGAVLSGQDKYVSQIQNQLIPGAGTAFEPMLEKYIGKKVVIKMMRKEKSIEYPGILKDYTTDFIEILDVEYNGKQLADIIASRNLALVRHLGK